MSNQLPQAVAALLPHKGNEQHISTSLRSEDYRERLAFECHKALLNIFIDCVCTRSFYHYKGGGLVSSCIGKGDSAQKAIFSAVVDWYSKGGEG